MSYLIVGASSGLGRELAYSFAKNKNDLILISRDDRDLASIKNDLEIKYKVNVTTIDINFGNLDEIDQKLFIEKKIFENLDGALFPIGLMFDADNIQLEKDKINELINANYLSICYTISRYIKESKNKNISIVGFGSVSGLLGRNINSYYASSKRALESFFESLAFNDSALNLKIQFYILGYLDTNLAFGKDLKLPKGNIKKLAKKVYKNKNKKFSKIYYPFYWNLISIILKNIPISLIIKLKNIFN